MLELRNISYEVKDAQENREILKDINLSVDNHFVAVTGPNGGGLMTGLRQSQGQTAAANRRWRR